MERASIKGLVLSGGKSQRMGRDKSALTYHDRPQVRYAFDLLSEFCEETFVSCRFEQKNEEHLKDLPKIEDAFEGIGPLGGIASAMQRDRECAWLVLACDLPFLKRETLEKLIREHDLEQKATCFINPEKGWKEPLCAIWGPSSREDVMRAIEEGHHCPRKILKHLETKDLSLDNPRALENVNTPEELEQTRQSLRG